MTSFKIYKKPYAKLILKILINKKIRLMKLKDYKRR